MSTYEDLMDQYRRDQIIKLKNGWGALCRDEVLGSYETKAEALNSLLAQYDFHEEDARDAWRAVKDARNEFIKRMTDQEKQLQEKNMRKLWKWMRQADPNYPNFPNWKTYRENCWSSLMSNDGGKQ
jgi:hypothetical protein